MNNYKEDMVSVSQHWDQPTTIKINLNTNQLNKNIAYLIHFVYFFIFFYV